MWQPIETAPKDGSLIFVYAPGREGLLWLMCPCAYHPDAGFCVDELREPTHWRPIPAMYDDPHVTALLQQCLRLGWWMFDALEDKDVCDEMKSNIRDWFDAMTKFHIPELN